MTTNEERKLEMRRRLLKIASRCGQTKTVLYLMGENLDVKRDKDGYSPLYHAAHKGKIDLMRTLLSKIPNATNKTHLCLDGWTAAHGACILNQPRALEILHENGANLNAKSFKIKKSLTPLHISASHGSIDCLKFLLAQGVEVNARDEKLETPFHYAAGNGKLQILKILDENDANICAESVKYWDEEEPSLKLTPLDKAAMHAQLDCLEYLLNRPYTTEMKRQAMWYALARGVDIEDKLMDILKLFLKKGFSVDVDLMNGQTPVIVLATRSREWCTISPPAVDLESFLDANYDIDAPFYPKPAEMAFTPPREQELNPYIQCIEYLINSDANVNLVSDKGSALHIAAANGDVILLELLLHHRAWPSIMCRPFNRTPLHCAAENGHLEIVIILLSKESVDIDVTSYKGETPVQLALEGGHTDVFEYLLTRGADVTLNFGMTNETNYTMASKAAEMGMRKELEMILGVAPIDEDQKQLDGALIGAAKGGKIDVLHELVQMGAIPTQSNYYSIFCKSPLTVAVLAGKRDSIETLFEFMDPDTQKEEANIALVAAVRKRDLDLINFLVEEKGVDINHKDEYGFSPITRATMWGIDNLVDYFLNYPHLDLLSPSTSGKTPESFIDQIYDEAVKTRLVNCIGDQKEQS